MDAIVNARLIGRAAHGPVLTARDIRMQFGEIRALDSVTVEIGRDELVAVIGPNGAGKTSMMHCLSGFYRPQRGEIRFDGALDRGARRPSGRARGRCPHVSGHAHLFQHDGG